jgi:hypothetical protein
MNQFFPFIHKKKEKKELEQLPLYIEEYEPRSEKIIETEKSDAHIIVIEL